MKTLGVRIDDGDINQCKKSKYMKQFTRFVVLNLSTIYIQKRGSIVFFCHGLSPELYSVDRRAFVRSDRLFKFSRPTFGSPPIGRAPHWITYRQTVRVFRLKQRAHTIRIGVDIFSKPHYRI